MAKTVQIEHDTPEMLQHEHLGVKIPKNVGIYSIEGPFFFGAITAFQSALSAVHSDVKAIIIRLRHVPFIDVTAMDSLRTFTGESDFSHNEHFERSLEEAVAIAGQKAALAV